MNKESIDSFLRIQFERRHWELQRLCHFPPTFSRNTNVSPLFLSRPIHRGSGLYLIDGYVGIICQEFERQYLERTGIPKNSTGRKWNPMWLVRNIANLKAVRPLQYIESENQLPNFCDSVMNYLESMPHSIMALKEVFASQKLLGVPLQQWAFMKEQKLLALQDYLRQVGDGA